MLNTNHATGARNELFAASYFMSLGWQVYWPQAKQSPADFIAEDPIGNFHKVQVKTAGWNKAAGPFHYLQCRMRTTSSTAYGPEAGKYDLMAVVFENELWVIPANTIASSNISLRSTNSNARVYPWDEYKVL